MGVAVNRERQAMRERVGPLMRDMAIRMSKYWAARQLGSAAEEERLAVEEIERHVEQLVDAAFTRGAHDMLDQTVTAALIPLPVLQKLRRHADSDDPALRRFG